MSRLFGWDYPPGVTGNEPEITGMWGPCDGCGLDVDDCECICPVCGELEAECGGCDEDEEE